MIFLVRIYLLACFCQLSQIRCFAEFFSVALVERTLFCIYIYIYTQTFHRVQIIQSDSIKSLGRKMYYSRLMYLLLILNNLFLNICL